MSWNLKNNDNDDETTWEKVIFPMEQYDEKTTLVQFIKACISIEPMRIFNQVLGAYESAQKQTLKSSCKTKTLM